MQLGRVVMTKGIADKIQSERQLAGFIWHCLQRHQSGDWGDVSKADKEANDQAVHELEGLLSAYHYSDGTKIWIITEADRSSTTVLFPNEY